MSSTLSVYTIRLTYLLTAVLNWIACSIVIANAWSAGPDYIVVVGTVLFTILWQLVWLISVLHVSGQRARHEARFDQSGHIKFD